MYFGGAYAYTILVCMRDISGHNVLASISVPIFFLSSLSCLWNMR